MDITVTPGPDAAVWLLSDLLGRPMGEITENPPGEFRIVPAGQARETMRAMKHGPFPSLDAALAEIERFTRSACRRVSPKHADGETSAH